MQGGEAANATGSAPGLGSILGGHQNANASSSPQTTVNVGPSAAPTIESQGRPNQNAAAPGSNAGTGQGAGGPSSNPGIVPVQPQPVVPGVNPGQGQGNRYLFTAQPIDPSMQFQGQPHTLQMHQNLNMPPAQQGQMMSQPLGQPMWPPQREQRYMDIPPIQQRNGFGQGIFDFSQIVNQSAAWNFGPPMGGRHANSRAVYLGNVPDNTTDDDLRELSAEFGDLDSVRYVSSKHCAFLNFREREAAQKMIERSQSKEIKLKNKVVSVRPAKEMSNSHGQPPPQHPSRSVYLGNVPDNATEESIRSLVDIACKESKKILWIRVMTGKRCAFINFEDVQGASDFLEAASATPLVLEGATLTSGWAKEKEAGSRQNGNGLSTPTRSIYVGNLASNSEESDIITLAEEHGKVQNVRLMPGKGHAFINFVSIEAAVKFMEKHAETPFTIQGVNLTCNWAKDPRTVYYAEPMFNPHKLHHHIQSHPPRDRKQRSKRHHMGGGHGHNPHMSRGPNAMHQPSKSIYLGNIPEDISKQEIVMFMERFGPIESIKILENKHCAFVNFYHIHSALNFVQQANFQPIEIRGKTLSVGFAKEVKSLHNSYGPHGGHGHPHGHQMHPQEWGVMPPPHHMNQMQHPPHNVPMASVQHPVPASMSNQVAGVDQQSETAAVAASPTDQDNQLYGHVGDNSVAEANVQSQSSGANGAPVEAEAAPASVTSS